jgi:hypothetical protein
MGFERQVNFRISADDHHLLEAARREFGSFKEGILAGLRGLEQQRLDRAAPPKPGKPTPPPAPPDAGEIDWWSPIASVATIFGRSPATVRKWIAEGRAQSRGVGRDLEVDIATVQLDRAPAATWIGIKSATLAKWTEQGKAKANSDGLYVFGELELPLSRAADRWELSKSEHAQLAERARQTSHGPMVRILDVVELAGSEDL